MRTHTHKHKHTHTQTQTQGEPTKAREVFQKGESKARSFGDAGFFQVPSPFLLLLLSPLSPVRSSYSSPFLLLLSSYSHLCICTRHASPGPFSFPYPTPLLTLILPSPPAPPHASPPPLLYSPHPTPTHTHIHTYIHTTHQSWALFELRQYTGPYSTPSPVSLTGPSGVARSRTAGIAVTEANARGAAENEKVSSSCFSLHCH